jgi:hypothetical protein
MPRRYGRWPTRDDIVEYLEEYVRRQGLRIEFGAELQRLERRDRELGTGNLEGGDACL